MKIKIEKNINIEKCYNRTNKSTRSHCRLAKSRKRTKTEKSRVNNKVKNGNIIDYNISEYIDQKSQSNQNNR